ncbi:MAG: sigma-54-dependent Fis family transcriptional regulator [Proteobacteria bacterium]|nr:MAG: sigma-54-dependent Fis family transcriptional regulator [Pseudomonadota bacterium]
MLVSILQIDDEEISHLLVSRSLRGWRPDGDLRISWARTPEEGLGLTRQSAFHVALVDLHFGGSADGFALVKALREADPALEILVVSASLSFASVQEAMRAGASDYIGKGFGPAELRHALDRALERRRWKAIERRAKEPRTGLHRDFVMVGGSAPMLRLKEALRKFAPAGAPVLLEGETGSGKEVAARALHVWGRDAAGPFVPVNCAAVPASTADSFFFGHERGAFTGAEKSRAGVFEEADGGTLFLDEVNSLPMDLQGRLLRVLQEREVRRLGGERTRPVEFRLVTATNQSLEELVRKGSFREDLYFRLAVLKVELPPLRERLEDIAALSSAFLPARTLAPEVLPVLQKHNWAGNVRELRNLLLAMDALTPPGEPLRLTSVPEHALKRFGGAVEGAAEAGIASFAEAQGVRERKFLEHAYRNARGNVSRMARELGVDRSHLHQKLVKTGVHRSRA